MVAALEDYRVRVDVMVRRDSDRNCGLAPARLSSLLRQNGQINAFRSALPLGSPIPLIILIGLC
jgi:hypothetical protein